VLVSSVRRLLDKSQGFSSLDIISLWLSENLSKGSKSKEITCYDNMGIESLLLLSTINTSWYGNLQENPLASNY